MQRKTVEKIFCVTLAALTLSMTACGSSGEAVKDVGNTVTEEAAAGNAGELSQCCYHRPEDYLSQRIRY